MAGFSPFGGHEKREPFSSGVVSFAFQSRGYGKGETY